MLKSRSREYYTWQNMRRRCLDAGNCQYKNYGGRGIKVCERWLESFDNFLSDMGEKPRGYTLDRIDNDGNYEPGNCRWATVKDQCANKRTTILHTRNGVTKCMSHWADEIGLKRRSVQMRISRGWPIELALTAPLNSYRMRNKAGAHPKSVYR